jgi:hypothetical protein
MMADEALWRRRFQIFLGLRLAGLVAFLAGVVIAYTDLVRQGGWPALGAIIAIMGAVDALVAPRLLKQMWERQDRGGR